MSGGTTLDLTLYMWDSDGVIGGSLEYNGTLFDAKTIACFAGCFETLAAAMAGQPDAAIERLPVLSAAQETEWFEKYDGPALTFPDGCIHEWIDRQASKTPGAIAVVCEDEQLTYRELQVRSNGLAHRLRELGVGQNSLVALCLNRSTDLAVAPSPSGRRVAPTFLWIRNFLGTAWHSCLRTRPPRFLLPKAHSWTGYLRIFRR